MSIMGSTSIWVVGWENEPLDMTCSHEPVHNRTARLLFFCLGDTSSFLKMSRVLQIGLVGRLASLPLNLTHMIVECHAQVQRDVDPVAYRCSYRFEALKWQLNWLVEGCLCLFQTSRPSNKLRKEPELFAKGVVKTGGEQPFHILIV